MDNKEPPDYNTYINEMLEMITSFSAGDFSARSELVMNHDELDAIMAGLNMLGEELQANVVTQDFLKILLSTLNDVIIAVDSNYEIIFINQSALHILGYTERELMGAPSRELFSETVFDHFNKPLHFNDKYIHKEETIFFTLTGERILFELSVIPFEWKSENKSGYLCIGYNLQQKNEMLNIMQLHDNVVRNMLEGFCLISEETGTIFYTNKRLDDMFGYDTGELAGMHKELAPFPPFSNREKGVDIAQSVAKSGSWKGEVNYLKKDGSEIWCSTSLTTFEQANLGTVWLVMHTDISQLKDLEFKLKELSLNDPLTGLRNRRALEEKFKEEWNRGLRGKYNIGFIMLDVDYFKDYNDHYGHQAGDAALVMIAEVLKKSARRTSDMAARYGGEEFVIVLPMTGLEETRALAESIRLEIEKKAWAHNTSVFGVLTVSCGVSSIIPSETSKYEDLLNLADQAMYKAKSGGENKVESL
jgi:diguanylate cyclase (GGDEF)-like protein/PAS domain S-box-containing protein